MRTYAQFGTDAFVARLFPEGFVGTYVDVGANEPVHGSNTYAFYERGWSGVLFEPVPAAAERLRKARPRDRVHQLAVSGAPGRADFYECGEASVSTLEPDEAAKRAAAGQAVRKYVVDVISLAEARRAGLIPREAPDFLTVDVEGHEAAVLEGCPFADGWLPRVIALEACLPCTDVPCHEDWEPSLLPFGYAPAGVCGINRVYQLKEVR